MLSRLSISNFLRKLNTFLITVRLGADPDQEEMEMNLFLKRTVSLLSKFPRIEIDSSPQMSRTLVLRESRA